MAFLHFTQLGHGAMDAIQSCLQQQSQGASAAAFLQRFPAAFQLGDVAFEPGLLLLQARASALLHRH